jgi:cyclophilin family peptidyl-prolyl cis-trans isomerase
MNKYISIIIVVVLIGFGVWFFTNNGMFSAKVQDPGLDDTNLETTMKDINNPDVPLVTEPTKTVDITNNNKKIMNATLKTNMGEITIEFFDADAPNTVANFQKLAKAGFYDSTKFHRVIKGFMIQGGDPNSKDDSKMNLWGTGDPGYKFADEIDPRSDLYVKVGYKKGVVAMANSGPNTNGSQFFIMNEDYNLPPLYTIFGKVTSGQDVVDKIALVKTGASDRPIDPVIIKSITLK